MAAKRKVGFISVLALVITLASGRAEAYPLVWSDIQRIGTSVLNSIMQELQIKNEFDSNMALIKEIQERGYGAAADDLFNDLKSDISDEFGNVVSDVKKEAQTAAKDLQKLAEDKAKAKLNNLLKKEKKLQDAEAAGNGQATSDDASADEAFYDKSYNWLKNNRAETPDATTPDGSEQPQTVQ